MDLTAPLTSEFEMATLEIINTMNRFTSALEDARHASSGYMEAMQRTRDVWRLYLRSLPYSQFRRERMK